MSSSRAPRPKRPAALDASIRAGADLPEHKRPKFDARNPHELAPDAPEEHDIFLEADQDAIGKQRVHRNAVELEGYETDSSEEGFNATRKHWASSEKKERKQAVDDEDEDMFGLDDLKDSDDDDDDKGKQGDDKKKVKFMKLDDIEGQDYGSRREFADIIDEDKGLGEGSSTDNDSNMEKDEEEIDPEVGEGGRKKNAPKIDAFNMREEMDEGRFDEAGNFIRKAKEKDAIHDSWLQGVSRKDMKKAREAMEKREAEKVERMKEDDALLTSDVLSTLIGCLDKGESILEALARVGAGMKKKKQPNKNSWRQKKKSNSEDTMEVDGKGKEAEDPAETRRKELVEKITGAADVLLTRGQPEVYDETRESLMRQYRKETGEDWVGPKNDDEESGAQPVNDSKWDYRWTDGRDGEAVYGPYDSTTMKSWNDHGFFGEEVEFRKVDSTEGWTRVPDFD